ncbi:MAG TPA: endonuclease/exonuclease/phosphatase family protein [Candidatus Marinimicrobia bacterium]|mgnify:CR=1 FL=1|nr:endonuclease/exonuclease/phosphatase family protein [Candidatus Neomarinimicrobiota bacterium]HRS52781.1 endonuclease/exonuclease/phosphatase family protein [Candidatus Neomarinimicrobiota bacterium]HRU93321.1 endonuclease/exonuclease/phosphatase family protein [Candidatus Neomarinimicrobiota bacterium]
MTKKKSSISKIILFLICVVIILIYGFNRIKDRLPRKLINVIAPTKITVMTYDINHGMGSDNVYNLSRISKVIKSESPHLVILNEVDYKTKRGFNDEQARRIAAELGMEFTFSRNYPIDGGWTGNAILSKFPIEFAENKIYKQDYGHDTKSLLHVIVNIGNIKVHVYGTQLSSDSIASSNQVKELLNFVFEWGNDSPVIIGGNFGMTPDYKRIYEMAYYFTDVGAYFQVDEFTYPASNPYLRLDYLFSNKLVMPLKIKVVDNEVTRLASDHLPVVAHFKILH